jgi:tetratricopeptide (TPR) repeat protein
VADAFYFDLFISYSRDDNPQGQISEIVARIKNEYQEFAGAGELRIFFDSSETPSASDQRRTVVEAIRGSRLLLVCLSPNYLQSENCSWELNQYLRHRAASLPAPENIGCIYFAEVPTNNDNGFEQRAARWVTELCLREHIDFRPWFDEGGVELREKTVKDLRETSEAQTNDKFGRTRSLIDAHGNLDRRNPHFVGRTAELRRLREIIAFGRPGVLTIINGPDGIGKTALAIEYGHIFAHEYAGRCWQIACGGRVDLRAALISLGGAGNLDLTFTEEEKRDLDLGLKRVLSELKQRADSGDPSRVLLLLDNVDQARLLSPDEVRRLPPVDWLRIVATTKLEEYELFGRQKDRVFVTLAELPDQEALALMERYQDDRKFGDVGTRAVALSIVQLLGGFTLAVERAAVFLSEPGSKFSSFYYQLRAEGLTTIVEAGPENFDEASSYFTKCLRAILRPTLKQLDDADRATLVFASLLPSDHVALPWLRTLVTQQFPDLSEERLLDSSSRWISRLQRLLKLRLVQTTAERCEVRMHRLLQEVIKQEAIGETIAAQEGALVAYVKERAAFLWEGWVRHEYRWEIRPLVAFAWQLLNRNDTEGAYLANQVFGPLRNLGNLAEAEQLLRQALSLDERNFGPDHPNVATCLNNLAALLHDSNRLQEAEMLYRRALAIDEKSFGASDGKVATCLNNLAALLYDTNRLQEAEVLYRRALTVDERSLGPSHPKLATHLNNLAQLLRATDRPDEAEPLYRRALAIDQEALGPNHPRIAGHLNNLAQLLHAINRLTEAESLYRRALAIDEESFGPDHPRIATHLSNLATLLKARDRFQEAEQMYRRALAIDQQSFGWDHPNVGTDLNNLAALLEASNRLPEAVQLMEMLLRILFRLRASTGREHPFLRTAVHNYVALMGEMRCDSGQILARLNGLARGSDSSSSAETLPTPGPQFQHYGVQRSPAFLARYRARFISLVRKAASFFGLNRRTPE